jgi:hypothetical protein
VSEEEASGEPHWIVTSSAGTDIAQVTGGKHTAPYVTINSPSGAVHIEMYNKVGTAVDWIHIRLKPSYQTDSDLLEAHIETGEPVDNGVVIYHGPIDIWRQLHDPETGILTRHALLVQHMPVLRSESE